MEEAPSARAPVFSFMPNLLLDNLLPVVVGQNVYGFNKHLAQIRHGDAGFDVRSKFGATTAQFEPEGLPGGIDDFEEIAKLRERLQFPLLGLAADGSFVVSSVHFDLVAGTFQRIGGTIRTGKAFLPQDVELQLGPKDSDAAWGFRMQCPWRLSLPAGDLGRLRTADHHGHRLVAHYRDAVVGKIPVRR